MTGVEFFILLVTFLIFLSLIWSSLRAGITPVPSSRMARREIIAASSSISSGTIIELGSGWGGLAVALAKKHPGQTVIGYELSFVPWLVSLVVGRLCGPGNLVFSRRNFLNLDLDAAALLVCYLHPGGMQKLAEKLDQEQPQVEMLISHTFALPGAEPDQTIRLDDLYRSPIYVYRLKDNQISRNEM